MFSPVEQHPVESDDERASDQRGEEDGPSARPRFPARERYESEKSGHERVARAGVEERRSPCDDAFADRYVRRAPKDGEGDKP